VARDWFIELEGDSFDLDRLATAFTDGPVTIRKESDRYRLREESLSDSDEAEYVRTELAETLRRINALARLQWGNDQGEVRPGSFGQSNDRGGTTWYGAGTLVARVRMRATGTVIGPDGQIVPDPPSPLPQKLQLAVTDQNVDDALNFLQRADPSWSELFKAYEVVRDDVGKIEGRGWASERELSRFSGTANHQDAAGREARHARMPTPPPTDPMPLDEARALIARVVSAWLTAKLEPSA
jgi:hypothetical protein